jgi:hypothetical protein
MDAGAGAFNALANYVPFRILLPEPGKGSILETAPPGVFGVTANDRSNGRWRSPLEDMPEF